MAERRTTDNASSWLYYLYGVDGIAGFRYNNTTYLFRKNVQGDVTHIYTESGMLVGQYAYDAWGNCATLQDTNGIATLNPFRYRGYYFDQENDLYYLQSRYYDPETCRFVNADDISYLDPETIGGLNLYAYCSNNPVMAVDHNGTIPEWLKWLGIGLAIVGTLLVVGAITVLSMGVGTAMLGTAMIGSILHGAAIGTLIGAGVGVLAGGLIGGFATNWSAEGILVGIGIGLGIGAIVGAVIGGSVGAIQYNMAANSWLNGKSAMINHFNSHGKDMGFKNVVEYTKAAKNVIKDGSYVASKNAYLMASNGSKYLFVGVGHNTKLITTF